MTTPTIVARGVKKSFGSGTLTVDAVRDVSLDIAAGQLALIMGPSGSGKTTLICVLAGLLRATEGEIELCGHTMTGASEGALARVRRQHLGFVFQTYNLFPALSALDNVREVLRLRGLGARESLDRARAALERVGMADRLTHRPDELSGGQKQRVAIARALAPEPDVVIGDEITAALDSTTALIVMRLLREELTPKRSIVLVTHDHRLEAFADRVIEIADGRVADDRLLSRRGGAPVAAS
ncbi:MAG: ABC transporter ATP-binding protein [Polyangiaceae bacterium]|jgi:putative ABC transport system ATP-binding protein